MVYIVDLTATTNNYNTHLLKSLKGYDVRYINYNTPFFLNLSFLVKRDKNYRFKRIVIGVEYIINFLILIFLTKIKKPSIVHFQWLPGMLFFNELQKVLLQLLKTSNTKVGLTVHNVVPHNLTEKEYVENFSSNFLKSYVCLDFFIIHNNSSKDRFLRLNKVIKKDKVYVVPHGLLHESKKSDRRKKERKKPIKLLCIGNVTPYKGYIDFVRNFNKLENDIKEQFIIQIYGNFVNKKELEEIEEYEYIEVKDGFIEEEEFVSLIDNCDYGLLPYKDISDSGVLFSFLARNKPVLFSNIARFVELFNGELSSCKITYPLDDFLQSLIEFDYSIQVKKIEEIKEDFSWDKIGKEYKNIYKNIK